ncbi:hypothetical protein H5410_039658 [Solanum commersonii]|uniref:Reverse transcriptase domain-containing protein n=1 Tax=Solanum commersonii TaxID=4109 RepID=A0A9J5XPV7_SOLCO|nr:hypothetical protein H5410_039658 [Solanum commersonii]
MDPAYRPSLLVSSNGGSGVLPFAGSDLVLSPSQWSSHVVGKISSWLDLDSEDEMLRRDSEITLKQEIAWASHLSLQSSHIFRLIPRLFPVVIMVGNIYFTAGEKSFEVVDISDDHSRWFLWIERSRRFTSRIKIDVNNLIWVCEVMKQASRGTRGLCRRWGRKVEAYIYRVVQNFNMYGRSVRIEAVLGDRKSSVIIPEIICNGGWADIAEKILGHLRSTSMPPRIPLARTFREAVSPFDWPVHTKNAATEVQNSIKISHAAELDSSKFLSQCLIGIFNDPFHSSPNTDVIQKWFLNRWKITVGLKITPLSHNQFLLEMPSRQEAARIMAGECGDRRRPELKLMHRSQNFNGLRPWAFRYMLGQKALSRDFVDTDEDTKRRHHLYWARICVKKSGTVLPNKIKLECSAGDSNATKDGKREASSLAPLKFTDRQVGQHVIFPVNSKFWDGVGPSTYKGKIAKANNVNGPLDYHKHGPKRRKHTKTFWKAKGPAQNKYVGTASSSLIVSNTFDPLANATEISSLNQETEISEALGGYTLEQLDVDDESEKIRIPRAPRISPRNNQLILASASDAHYFSQNFCDSSSLSCSDEGNITPTIIETSKWTKLARPSGGLNDINKRSTIKSLIRKWNPDVICLQETKLEEWSSLITGQLWGNRWASWAKLKANGTRGGVIILWDKRSWVNISTHQGIYTVSCMLESVQENFRWCFTGVYGPHTNIEREDLWYELVAIRGLWDNSWVRGGDFNVCRFESERYNCIRRSKAMSSFNDTISDLGLMDLPLPEAFYTWTRGDDPIQASRIDRFLISPEWNDCFTAINQLALSSVVSDHRPILLKCGDWESNPSYFKFENMWLEEEGFLEKVKIWWQSYSVNGTPDFILYQKLRYLKKDISNWNREVFGKIDTNKNRALEELTVIEHALENRAQTPEEKSKVLCLKLELQKLAKIEEEGDSNTKYFQKVANGRRRNNTIDKLKIGPLLALKIWHPSPWMKEISWKEILKRRKCMLPSRLVHLTRLQKAWEVIKYEVIGALNYFHHNCHMVKSYNASFIALIPKKKGSIELKDYRPINLIGSVYKLTTKILAERLKFVIGKLVSGYQNAFVKGRQISDAVLIANEVLDWK